MERNQIHPAAKAFTLVELLAIIAVVALLACVVVPALARAKQSPQTALCLSNHKQLILAALMYVEDDGGLWFPNQSSGQTGERDWVTDIENFTAGNPNNYDLRVLSNPGTNFFANYIKSPRIFHCPGDQSRVPEGPRIRSVSANAAVGTVWNGAELSCPLKRGDPVTGQWLSGFLTDCNNTFRRYAKTSDMVAPAPAQLFVFLDEHANSINDSEFEVQVANTNIGADWIDIPASYHNGAVGISFADGHVEMHKWIGTAVPNVPISWTGSGGGGLPVVANLQDVQDIRWLQRRTSALNQ